MTVQRTACRDCGRPIQLRQGTDGAWHPYDRDGSLHDCPGRARQPGKSVAPRGRGGERSATDRSHGRRSGAAAGTPARPAGEPEPKLSPAMLLVVGALGLVVAWGLVVRGNGAVPPPVAPRVGQEVLGDAGGDAFGTTDPCAAFDAQIWAQTLFVGAPDDHGDLDPDGDGIACESLPLGAAPALWIETVPAEAEAVSLLKTIDGDTIDVRRADGVVERVRLVGIDTPETGLGSQPLECYGAEASRFTETLLADAGGVVYLETDVEERDRYGRLLRWVWFERNGRTYLANEAIVRSGSAERFRDTPNRRYLDQLVAAEVFARQQGYGMWGACG